MNKKCKIIYLFGMIASGLLLGGVAIAQSTDAYRSIYQLQITRTLPGGQADMVSGPLTVYLRLEVISNQQYHFMIGRIVSGEFMSIPIGDWDENGGDADSSLVATTKRRAYQFKEKIVSPYQLAFADSAAFAAASFPADAIVQAPGSVTLLLDSNYPSYVKPFPQIMGNEFAIREMKTHGATAISCKLVNVEKIQFNFQSLLGKTASFAKTNDLAPLPW